MNSDWKKKGKANALVILFVFLFLSLIFYSIAGRQEIKERLEFEKAITYGLLEKEFGEIDGIGEKLDGLDNILQREFVEKYRKPIFCMVIISPDYLFTRLDFKNKNLESIDI